MSDNQFVTPTAGQADWDASISADFAILERGYHLTERAGVAINTGNVVWINSGGYAFPFNPNSQTIWPHAFAYTAASSGDSIRLLAWGISRSLGITSPAIPGFELFVSALTPGLVVTSYGGADRRIGIGLVGQGVLFRPVWNYVQERMTTSVAINAVTGSNHLFSVDVGMMGWNRETKMIGNSADLVELSWYKDSARTQLLYLTKSGGVTTVGSFLDRAGWPYENNFNVGSLVYGTLQIKSAAAVGSDTISIQMVWDRTR